MNERDLRNVGQWVLAMCIFWGSLFCWVFGWKGSP